MLLSSDWAHASTKKKGRKTELCMPKFDLMNKSKFYTKFRKTKVKKGEEKEWNPTENENERCEAMGVIRIESIYLSSAHASVQAKVDEVAMSFEGMTTESLLPEPEEEEENEW